MSIWLNDKTKVIVQGMTGREGTFHTGNMIKYGTNVVAGVTPGKGGESHLGLPIFDNCSEAVKGTGATASVIFVPARFCLAAVQDAVVSGVKFLVVITEGIPLHDEIKIGALVRKEEVIMVGPNCPGIFSVGQASMGIMPSSIFKRDCCTPSPDTSLVIEVFAVFLAILSISSIYTIPISAFLTS